MIDDGFIFADFRKIVCFPGHFAFVVGGGAHAAVVAYAVAYVVAVVAAVVVAVDTAAVAVVVVAVSVVVAADDE